MSVEEPAPGDGRAEEPAPGEGRPEEPAREGGAQRRGRPRVRAPRRLARRATESTRRASERIPPRAELIEQAAEASRAGVRTRRDRVVATARPILQSAVAASAAWLVATEVVGHATPFFAPISAVITLGLTSGQRRRRAFELAIGVSVGIFIADLLVRAIGTGTWQVGVVTGLAMLAATLVGGGTLLASQAGASAVLVATLQPPEGFDFTRSLDALVGSAIALAVGAVVLPVDPIRLIREGIGPVFDRFAAVLGRIADALEHRDPRDADAALAAVAQLDAGYAHLTETLAEAGDAARISLGRRGALGGLERYVGAVRELGLAIENTRALARGATRAMALDDSIPPEVPAAIQELAIAARELTALLEEDEPDPSRDAALRAVRLANAVLGETSNLSAVHIVGQVRLVAVDLLRAGGVPRAEAQHAVRTAPGEQLGQNDG